MSCSTGECQGSSSGEGCASSMECEWGLTCVNGTCAAWAELGEDCQGTETESNCNTSLTCGFGNVCVALLSKVAGENCNTNTECGNGTFCFNGSCLSVSSSGVDCDPEAPNCAAGETCFCNISGAKFTCGRIVPGTQLCSSCASALLDCAVAHQCRTFTGSPQGSSCVAANCNAESKCFYNCILNNDPTLQFSTLPAGCTDNLFKSVLACNSDCTNVALAVEVEGSGSCRNVPFLL
jgi:hypothetical protein